ncbi:MAG TPA: histidine phosphatase family protein [Rubrivivax sp.]|nr:histidine phosphatase family protein [Rubrivivax sp.]
MRIEATRRRWLLLAAQAITSAAAAQGSGDWALVQPGTAVLFRHANAPGIGDPPQFRLDDCSTQRNLDAAGRQQAAQIGKQFRQRGIEVKTVWSSRWCRARETADLAFPGLRRDEPAFDSMFGRGATSAAQTEAAKALLLQWTGPGVLVVFSHQVNISALTGTATSSGEGVIVKAEGGGLQVMGKVRP